MYSSETWAMKVDYMQRLERAEKMMTNNVVWMMYGVMLKDRKKSEEFRERLPIVSMSDRVRQVDE
jgi:hypothetical protein